jgi:hypothetical protein
MSGYGEIEMPSEHSEFRSFYSTDFQEGSDRFRLTFSSLYSASEYRHLVWLDLFPWQGRRTFPLIKLLQNLQTSSKSANFLTDSDSH